MWKNLSFACADVDDSCVFTVSDISNVIVRERGVVSVTKVFGRDNLVKFGGKIDDRDKRQLFEVLQEHGVWIDGADFGKLIFSVRDWVGDAFAVDGRAYALIKSFDIADYEKGFFGTVDVPDTIEINIPQDFGIESGVLQSSMSARN